MLLSSPKLERPFKMQQALATILVVEDDISLAETLAFNLESEGYHVLVANDGGAAVRLAYSEHPDLVVLDLMLPGYDGFDVCRLLRRKLAVPILVLSAHDSEADKVRVLDLGADSYVTKPFKLRELLARVRALLRRIETSATTASTSQRPLLSVSPNANTTANNSRLVMRGLTIDLIRREVFMSDREVLLTRREFDLLAILARHPGQVLSRAALLNQVWGDDFVGRDRAVDGCVRSLRFKLEADEAEPLLIQTVYGSGYKLVPPKT